MAHSLPPSLDFPRIKILAIGNVGVGKSCYIKRYCESRFVTKYIPTIGIDYGVKKVELKPSTFAEHQVRINGAAACASGLSAPPAAVRVNFWDVSGGEEAQDVRNEFYDAAQGVVLMYDVRDASSFEALDGWWKELGGYIKLPTAGPGDKAPSPIKPSTTANTPAGKMVGSLQGRCPVVILCATKVDDVLVQGTPGTAKRVVTEEQGQKWAAAHGGLPYYEVSSSSSAQVMESMDDLIYDVVAKFM